MEPIGVGIVGLCTSNDPTKAGAWAAIAHLPFLRKSPKYRIAALCNSSVSAAELSIAHHGLDDNVNAYGSPKNLVQDRAVDLVVTCVNVGKHFDLAEAALLAKKAVYVEWPLGATTAEAERMMQIAGDSALKTVVGVQARADPLIVKVKQLIDGGLIGKVMSSTAVGHMGGKSVSKWPQSLKYYLDIKSGGNFFTIHFGHFLDAFTHVLGDFSELQSTLKTQYPTIQLLEYLGAFIDPAYRKTCPDHVLVQGVLSSGTVPSISYRTVEVSVDGVGLRWLISGTEGEIELTTPETPLQMGMPGATLKMRRNGRHAGNVDFGGDRAFLEILAPGKNVALTYEAFANGDTESYANFESAVGIHRLLDRIVASAQLSRSF